MQIPDRYSLFLTQRQIEDRLSEMAHEISGKWHPENTLLVGILGGTIFFLTDLARHLDPAYRMDTLSLSSYHGAMRSSGRVQINKDVTLDCAGRDILILDDILDSGLTLAYALDHLKARGAANVECAVLLAKERHRAACKAHYVGFWVPDLFFIGYGLDIDGRFRALREIYAGKNRMTDLAIAIDLGGTAIKSGLVTEDGRLIENRTAPTGGDLSPDAVSHKLVGILGEEYARASTLGRRVLGAGIGSPGGIYKDRSTVSQSPNFPGWKDVNLKQMVEAGLPFPVLLENDGNLAALGESWAGAGRGVDSMILFTLGTGVGGGVILDKKIWQGAWGMAGELGHVNISPDGPVCGCGNRGCLEVYANKEAIVRMARAALVRNQAPVLEKLARGRSDDIEPETVYQAAEAGCEASRRIFREAGRALGIASASILNVLNMELILIGGGIGGAFDLIAPAAREEILLRAFRVPAERVVVKAASLGNDAGMLGAARLIFDSFG